MDEITEAVVKRKRGRPKSPNFGKELAKPGETSGFVRMAKVAWDMPPVDLADVNQVEKRATEYFNYCINNDCIPNKATLCSWIGISRTTLYEWETGFSRGPAHQALAKRISTMMESVLVELLTNNKVMPASAIFLLKNHAGYRDQIEISAVQEAPLGQLQDPETLAAKIEADIVDD